MSPSRLKENQTTYFDIFLKPNNIHDILSQAYQANTPGSPSFKKFLTPSEFGAKFGASNDSINSWVHFLNNNGLHTRVMKNRLLIKVSGKVSIIQRLFNMKFINAEYHRNPIQFGNAAPRIPKKMKKSVLSITGLTEHNPRYLSVYSSMPFSRKSNNSSSNIGFTKHFSNHYHLSPLYSKNMLGQGETVGIIAFENIKKSNAFSFWKHEHANINKKRLKVEKISSPMYNSRNTVQDSDETTVDAEYSGSVAPKANVKIYYVNSSEPTLTNFIDAYEQSYDENVNCSTSNSWGLMDSGLIRILRNRRLLTPAYKTLLSLIFAQGDLQGISSFIASGDSGAYNFMVRSNIKKQAMLDRSLNSSDVAISNPFITSVGGTSLPFKIKVFPQSNECISNTRERSWGGDYYWNIFKKNPNLIERHPEILVNATVGSTGGFSHQYQTPVYQENISGVNTFCARNYLSILGQPIFNSHLITGSDNGRNYPDLSANADPLSGYYFYKASKKFSNWGTTGGTSIVSPQYAASTAVITSGHNRIRMGFWNPQIYKLAMSSASPFTPLNFTDENSNLYYTGQPGTIYNQATGLGVTNFNKLFELYK